MKEGTKKYADEAYETVKYAASVIGSRLPGSKGEKAFADHMADKLRAIGVTPKKEEFAVSPRSAIGGIPYAGYAGLIMSLAAYPALHIPSIWFAIAAFGILAAVWLISCCFLYQTWSDMFFPRKISQNVYGEITPPDGRYDYTIMLSAHTDTSWCWKHSEFNHRYGDNIAKGFANVIAKVGFGAVCFEGNIDFYGKCGFTYARTFGIRYHGLPEGADDSFFLCKELVPGYLNGITGVYQTPKGYYVDDADVEAFDKAFPPKEKLKLPGQLF